MAGFEIGDRVRFTRRSEYTFTGGTIEWGDEGQVTDVDHHSTWPYMVKFDQDSRPEGVPMNANEIELVEPAPGRDAPKVGDTVRVVLEGKASFTSLGRLRIGTGSGANVVFDEGDHVKSIEILKPAKPSAKDLPVGSVVKNPVPQGTVWLKLGRDSWSSVGSTKCYPDLHIDRFDWTLLVAQESE